MSNRVKIGKISFSEKKYNKMVKRSDIFDTDEYRINCYVCSSCGHTIKTIEVDNGVTPSGITCPECKERMISTFYNWSKYEDIPVTMEWYRPNYKFTMALSGENREHVMKEGLLLRPFVTTAIQDGGVSCE